MATPRMAAGAIFFDERDRVLVVRPTYKPHWDVPGGYVEPRESPAAACRREVHEELGITPPLGQLLVVDWAPSDVEGDKLLFLFDGQLLDEHAQQAFKLPDGELSDWAFLRADEVPDYLIPRLARRVLAAIDSRLSKSGTTYLEHGVPFAATAATGSSCTAGQGLPGYVGAPDDRAEI